MKRAKDLYQKLISDENLRLAILTVNATHKWHPHHRPNKTVLRVEADIDGYVEKLREIIVNGYDAAPPRIARRWDKAPENGGTYQSRDCGLTSMFTMRSFKFWNRC